MQIQIITRFWIAARTMFARMRAALGDALAARAALSLDHKHAVRTWLAPLEAMARKTALIHALALLERGDTRSAVGVTHTHPLTSQAHPTTCKCVCVTPHHPPRAPSLRLWPRTPAGVAAPNRNSAQLAAARTMRRSEPERLARRVDALARMLARPLAAARRLARALSAKPHLALKLALTPTPRTPLYPEPEYAQATSRAFSDAYAWSTRHAPDSS